MSRLRTTLLSLAAAGAVAALPAAPAHAAWSAPGAATVAGEGVAPSVDLDAAGRLLVGYGRRLHGSTRAEVRRGTLRHGLAGPPAIASSDAALESGASAGLVGVGGQALAAWLATDRTAWVELLDARNGGMRRIALDGEADPPRVLHGADGSTRIAVASRAGLRVVQPGGADVRFRDVTYDVAATVDVAGRVVAAWANGGRMFVATDGGAPQELPTPGYARRPQLAATRDGHVVVAWASNAGAGNAVLAASRPAGGPFGAPREVVPASYGAFGVTLTPATNGDAILTFADTGLRRGWGSAVGVLRARELGPDLAAISRVVRLSGNGERTHGAGAAADPSGTFVVWSSQGAVHARRLAPGAIRGSERLVSHHPVDGHGIPAVAGGPAGGAAAAWVYAGRVRVARER